MADFAKWVVACEPALPWEQGAFLRAYEANRAGAHSAALEASPVATIIIDYMQSHDSWAGSMTDLLKLLTQLTGVTPAAWPKSARGLSGAIERCRPALRATGIEIHDIGVEPRTNRHCIRIIKRLAASNIEATTDATGGASPPPPNMFPRSL